MILGQKNFCVWYAEKYGYRCITTYITCTSASTVHMSCAVKQQSGKDTRFCVAEEVQVDEQTLKRTRRYPELAMYCTLHIT